MAHRSGPLTAAIALLFLACPPSASDLPELEPPAWQDGETAVYDVIRSDSVLYRSTMVLRFDEEFGVPTVEATTVVEPTQAQQFFFDSAAVVFHRDSLKPIRSYRSLETEIGIFDITVDYEPTRALVERQSIDGIEKEQLKMPRGALDNEMVVPFLRSIPLATGTEFGLHTVVPIDLRVVNAQVRVLGTKQVTTELGNIICREVALDVPSKEIRYWVELEEPHRLVGLHDPETETEMLLVRYRPGGTDALLAEPSPAEMP